MDKGFETWLKRHALDQWLKEHPDEHEQIYQDYQWETIQNEPDKWVDWVVRNPELAEKHFPKLMNGLKNRLREKPDFSFAQIIQKLSEHFPKWQQQTAGSLNAGKQKLIEQYLTAIELVLSNEHSASEIINAAVASVKDELLEQKEYWKEELKNTKGTVKAKVDAPTPVQPKPVMNTEAIPSVFGILKGFFSSEHQKKLYSILQSGGNINGPMLFLENGNRLADAFKQLYDADFITGCTKRELESWIAHNFQYYHRGQVKAFTLRYLNDIVSTNKNMCQRPILNVVKERSTGKYVITKP